MENPPPPPPLPPVPPPPPGIPNDNPNLNENILNFQQQQVLKKVATRSNGSGIFSHSSELSHILNKKSHQAASKHIERINAIKSRIDDKDFASYEDALQVFRASRELEEELAVVNPHVLARNGWPSFDLDEMSKAISSVSALSTAVSLAMKVAEDFDLIERSYREIIECKRAIRGVESCFDRMRMSVPDEVLDQTRSALLSLASRMFDIAFKRYDRVSQCTSKFDLAYAVKKAYSCLAIAHSVGMNLNETNLVAQVEKTQQCINKLAAEHSAILGTEIISDRDEIDGDPSQYSKFVSKSRASIPAGPPSAQLVVFAREGDARRVNDLLAEGIDPNTIDKSGFSPLYGAVSRGKLEVAKLLLDAGADPNLQCKGNSCLHVAIDGVSDPIICCKLVHLLLNAGADFLATNAKGETAMHVACRSCQYQAIKALVEACGADVLFVHDGYKRLPLQILAIKADFSSTIAPPPQVNLGIDLTRYLLSTEFSDITFEVEGERFPAHKIVLCAQCSPFRSMLDSSSPWKESGNGCIRLSDISAIGFKHFLQWVYTGEAGLVGEDVGVWIELLSLGDRFLLPSLKSKAEYVLSRIVTAEIVLPLHYHASLHQASNLSKAAKSFILNNYESLVKSDVNYQTLFGILDEQASSSGDSQKVHQ